VRSLTVTAAAEKTQEIFVSAGSAAQVLTGCVVIAVGLGQRRSGFAALAVVAWRDGSLETRRKGPCPLAVPAAGMTIEELPEDMRARFHCISQLIEEFGLERVGEPHVKHLRGTIWEMRMKGRDGISRALNVT
jgi:hypothetical protein